MTQLAACCGCQGPNNLWYAVLGCIDYQHTFDAYICRGCVNTGQQFICRICGDNADEYAVLTQEGWYSSWGEQFMF